MSVLQTTPFTHYQNKLLGSALGQAATELKAFAERHRGEDRCYDKPMTLEELVDSTVSEPCLFQRTASDYARYFLSTHTLNSVMTDFIQPHQPENIIACGDHSLFTWTLHKQPTRNSEQSYQQRDVSDSPEWGFKFDDFPFDPPFTANPFTVTSTDSFCFRSFTTLFHHSFPNILLSVLSGLPVVVYASKPIDPQEVINVGRFLASLCLNGASNKPNPLIRVNETYEEVDIFHSRFCQIHVVCTTTDPQPEQTSGVCQLDISRSFTGMPYSKRQMKDTPIDGFVRFATKSKVSLELKFWEMMIEYSRLSMGSYFSSTIGSCRNQSGDHWIIEV